MVSKFSNRLPEILLRLGIRQAELARAANISVVTLNKLYLGSIEGSVSTHSRCVYGIQRILRDRRIEYNQNLITRDAIFPPSTDKKNPELKKFRSRF